MQKKWTKQFDLAWKKHGQAVRLLECSHAVMIPKTDPRQSRAKKHVCSICAAKEAERAKTPDPKTKAALNAIIKAHGLDQVLAALVAKEKHDNHRRAALKSARQRRWKKPLPNGHDVPALPANT